MKLKKKFISKEIKIDKMILSGEVASHLELYQQYYENMYQSTISFSELIEEMIVAFMKSDRDFMKQIKSSSESTANINL